MHPKPRFYCKTLAKSHQNIMLPHFALWCLLLSKIVKAAKPLTFHTIWTLKKIEQTNKKKVSCAHLLFIFVLPIENSKLPQKWTFVFPNFLPDVRLCLPFFFVVRIF